MDITPNAFSNYPPPPLSVSLLTVTLEALSVETIEKGATVAAECETLVVVDLEPVRHIDAEPSLAS